MPDLSKAKAALIPSLMVAICLFWAIGYVQSVRANPEHDAAALALIGPLIWIMVPLGILTVLQAVWAASGGNLTEQHGLNSWKRLFYLGSLLIFLIALPWLGFLGAGLPFFVIVSFILGFRNGLMLAVLTAGLTLLIWLGFSELLGVSLPLYPGHPS